MSIALSRSSTTHFCSSSMVVWTSGGDEGSGPASSARGAGPCRMVFPSSPRAEALGCRGLLASLLGFSELRWVVQSKVSSQSKMIAVWCLGGLWTEGSQIFK
ncbi:hypothetical protein HWI79_1603 [Cryptosporidium felis]|nr:hypothetical protein HWI79_1603 [Cryptosporidium felis]